MRMVAVGALEHWSTGALEEHWSTGGWRLEAGGWRLAVVVSLVVRIRTCTKLLSVTFRRTKARFP